MKRYFLLAVVLLISATVVRAQMSAHYINVGQADSILLEFKTGAILIDAGGEATSDNRDKDHLIAFLNQFFDRRTDLHRTLTAVIISHPHIDHTKNLVAVMQTFRVQKLIDGGNTRGSGIAPLKTARTMAGSHYRAIKDSEIDALPGKTGMKLFPSLQTSSDADVRLLMASRGCDNANNDSLIVLVRYKSASYLFDGDAETEDDGSCLGEVPELISFYDGTDLLNVDVYKVGHHGSTNATDKDFLNAMTPKIAVISAGIHTQHDPGPFHAFQFGHPRENVVALLEDSLSMNRDPARDFYTMLKVRTVNEPRRIQKALYCTCWDGDVVVKTDASGSTLNVETSGR